MFELSLGVVVLFLRFIGFMGVLVHKFFGVQIYEFFDVWITVFITNSPCKTRRLWLWRANKIIILLGAGV